MIGTDFYVTEIMFYSKFHTAIFYLFLNAAAPISRLYMVKMELNVKFKLPTRIIINSFLCWPVQFA